MPVNYTEALARARIAKAAREAKLALEAAESDMTIDHEYTAEDFFAAVFGGSSDTALTAPKPITPAATKIPAKVKEGYIAVYCSIERETEKAAFIKVRQDVGGNMVTVVWWIPLSQVSYIQRSRYDLPFRDLIHVKQWVMDKNGYKPNSETI